MDPIQKVEILKALADETRLAIVRRVANKDCASSGCDIVNACSNSSRLSQPTRSHHFGKLVSAGILTEEKDGTSKKYRVDTEMLLSIGIDINKL